MLSATGHSWFPAGVILVDAVACLVALLASGSRVDREFDEGTLLTWFNAAQIVAIGALGLSILSLRIVHQRKKSAGQHFWLLVFLGSILLALDETTLIHERIGKLKWWATLTSQSLPIVHDPGDLILAVYVVVGLIIAWLFRREVTAHRPALVWLVVGSACEVGSLLIDALPFSLAGRNQAWEWVIVEETLKVVGFGALLGGVYLRYQAERDALLRRVREDAERVD